MKKINIVLLLMITGTLLAQSHSSYVDLGLPSGTQWKIINEGELLTYDEAINRYGDKMPTREQFEELLDYCEEEWTGKGMKLTGPNGKFIILQATGNYDCSGKYQNKYNMDYWSRTQYKDGTAYAIFYWYRDKEVTNGYCTISKGISGGRGNSHKCNKYAIRLVK